MTSNYFGSHLEIDASKIDLTYAFNGCQNGHRTNTYFCGVCGERTTKQIRMARVYPTNIGYDSLDGKWEASVSVITQRRIG
jgi:hypothetical protein